MVAGALVEACKVPPVALEMEHICLRLEGQVVHVTAHVISFIGLEVIPGVVYHLCPDLGRWAIQSSAK